MHGGFTAANKDDGKEPFLLQGVDTLSDIVQIKSLTGNYTPMSGPDLWTPAPEEGGLRVNPCSCAAAPTRCSS